MRQQLKRLENCAYRGDSFLAMKSILFSIVAAVVLVGCGKSQQDITVDMILKSATADIDPKSSIQNAAKAGNIEVVKKHLASGVDVNEDAGFGMTALQNAAAFGHREIVELLIANGADVNIRNLMSLTALDQASMLDFTDTIDLLRKHGGKTGAELWAEESILGAANIGDIKLVKKYLSDGADVNEKGDSGETALHLAATKAVTELLISKGADVNAMNDFGNTPLDEFDEGEIADLLRKHGGKTGEELKAEGK